MKRAFILTAYNRPEYLAPVLDSLRSVRNWEDWHVVFSIEPSPVLHEIQRLIAPFLAKIRTETSFEVIVNPERYGVLHHPWVGFERLFREQGFDFVVRAEDDVLIANDTLEYFKWVSETYQDDPQIATAHAFSEGTQGDTAEVIRTPGFNPLVWGTWNDRWSDTLGPTWDHDYSTFNGHPGNQSGWDWNINTRLFPEKGWNSIRPVVSRSAHIGVIGTHGTAENFQELDGFSLTQNRQDFFEGRYY